MDHYAHDDLRLQSRRMTRGYLLALFIIGLSSLYAYVTLKTTLQQQQHLNHLQMVSNQLQLSLRDTFDRAGDLKDAVRDAPPSQRLISQIKRRVRSELDRLKKLHAQANDNLLALSATGEAHSVAALYHEAPFSLNERLEDFSNRIESMLADTTATPNDSTLYWMPIDASAADAGYLTKGYRTAGEHTQALINAHNVQIEQTQQRLSLLIFGVLLVVSLLIFRPLMQGLKRVHSRVLNAQSELEYLAFYDPETELYNATGAGRFCHDYESLLVVRIRNMTDVSNVVGAGNERRFLTLFAATIAGAFKETDLIARTGSDEFAVLTTDRLQNATDAMFERVYEQTRRLVVGNTPVYVEVGMGWEQLSTRDFTERLANARLAERAYHPTIPKVPRFKPSFRTELEFENLMADQIREAIGHGEFTPFYQLKVSTTDWQVCGMEALCRWIKPDGTIVSPADFIPVAERKGLIVDITWQLINQVVNDLQQWHRAGLQPGAVAVNVAEAVLLDQRFNEKFQHTLTSVRQFGQPEQLLELEITENVALSGASRDVDHSLKIVRDAGIDIALDDFGTGFASLSSVVDLDIDIIKIDRSFVHDMMQNEKNRAVVEGVLSICNTLNKKSVVEGVECGDQATLLRELGADSIQGFYFHRPSSFTDVTATLKGWSHDQAA